MSSIYQTVISIISKPTENRVNHEIDLVLPWFVNLFRKKAAVFGDVTPEVIRDIVKNCDFQTKQKDEIIIKQGDVGDCFYINLHGNVSIYINHKQHDSTDTIDDDQSSALNDQSNPDFSSSSQVFPKNDAQISKKIRDRLGNFVISLDAGEGFGEVALISDDVRTASIIADEKTDLMVVKKALYRRCLLAPKERRIKEKEEFINQSPFFSNWTKKMKKLLNLCLEREIIPYDSYLGKQGDNTDKIYFLISGTAKITVDPTMHAAQYPELYPLKLPENKGQEIISSWMDEKSGNGKSNNTKRYERRNSQAILRRGFTFAEAEQRLKTKNFEVGILGSGEINGMCEMVLDMKSYMQSVRCLEDCDVFYILKASYNRLIAKRNPNCITTMKEYVYRKLSARIERLQSLNHNIDLYRSIHYSLEIFLREQRKIKKIPQNVINSNIHQIATQQPSNIPACLKLPPRGPIIQVDFKTQIKQKKPIKNNNLPNNLLLTQYTNNSNRIPSQKEEVTDNEDQDSSAISSDSKGLSNNSYKEQNNKGNVEKVLNLGITSNKALNELENRIMSWHMENGCKNPLFTTLHRIDMKKIKEVKSGCEIRLKPSKNDTQNRNQRNSAGSGSSSSSFDNNDSDDEIFNYHQNRTNNFMKFNPHSLTSVAAAVTGGLVSNNMSEISSYENEVFEYEKHSHSPTYGTHYRQQIQHESIHREQIHNHNNITNNSKKYSIQNLTDNDNKYYKRTSLPVKFNDNVQEYFIVKSKSDEIIRKASVYTTSRHNSMFYNTQFSPYLFRKLSMSQVKAHCSGKTYSKEEYLALKDELRRQTRKCSVSSAHL